MSPYRLVATDLDGTLLRPDGTLSAYTLDVVTRLAANGVDTVFVTARHPSAILLLDTVLPVLTQAVSCVGGALCELPSGKVLRYEGIPAAVAVALAAEIRRHAPGVAFGWVYPELPNDVFVEQTYFAPGTGPGWPTGVAEQIDRPVLKMFAQADKSSQAGFPELVAGLLAGRARVAHTFTGFVDLVASGVSKSAGLAALCAERGIAAGDVLAFGDTVADVDMLRWAGRGIAVANAERPVLAAADEIIGSCDDDGVARFLARDVPAIGGSLR